MSNEVAKRVSARLPVGQESIESAIDSSTYRQVQEAINLREEEQRCLPGKRVAILDLVKTMGCLDM